MRRRSARNLFWTLAIGSGMYAMIGPRLDAVQGTVGLAFAPVTRVSYQASMWGTRVLQGERPIDAASPGRPRGLSKIAAENEILRERNRYLQAQLEELQKIHRDRSKLGQGLLARCAPASVVFRNGENDRDVLGVLNSDFADLKVGQKALQYGETTVGVAGVVSAVGVASAQVRLVSDPAFVVEARFARFSEEAGEATFLTGPNPVFEGAGNGKCRVARYREADLADSGVRVGDYVTVNDRTWDPALLGLRLGKVTKIEPLPDEPGFARLDVVPDVDFGKLGEVMVLVR